jgi:glycerol uptake facilitator-like aquaporin
MFFSIYFVFILSGTLYKNHFNPFITIKLVLGNQIHNPILCSFGLNMIYLVFFDDMSILKKKLKV